MFENIQVAWHQALEAYASEGVKGIIRRSFFWKRIAIPVEMDLENIPSFSTDVFREAGCSFDEIHTDDLRAEKWVFITPSRGYKALCHLKQGWRHFAIHQNGRVIGDVWCVTPRRGGSPIAHPDLNMLGIVCGNQDAYAFDAYIAPAFRGRNLAAPLQHCLQVVLKAEGIEKVYGYYMGDNHPALWMHRLLRFKELPKRKISRFLWFRKSEVVGNFNLSDKSTPTVPRRWSERDKNL
jgi:GNAT superfamily N-acetyltransferase